MRLCPGCRELFDLEPLILKGSEAGLCPRCAAIDELMAASAALAAKLEGALRRGGRRHPYTRKLIERVSNAIEFARATR